jgi:hypothetical protein
MRRQSLILVALYATTWYLGWPQAARSLSSGSNCNAPYYRTLDLAPVGPGPFELAKVLCQRVQVDFKQLDARHGRSALDVRVVSECVVESG